MNRSGEFIKQPGGYKAFIPKPLPPDPPIKLEGTLQHLLSEAYMSIARLDGMAYTLPNPELLITMYIKKEALLSSQIEGTQASLEDIFEFESGDKIKNINDVKEVINYIKVLNYGMDRIKGFPMSLRLIKEIHAILLKGMRGENKTPGEFKKSQNWLGPQGYSLTEATFVPTPPHETVKALGELELYLHKEKNMPVLIECALIHYQFETIHPFLDGNGRLGRLLITFYLYWKDVIQKPLLYLSYYFKKNRQEYYDRLNLVRDKGDYEQWIIFFLKGIIQTAQSAIETAKRILELQNNHRNLLWQSNISSPLAVGLLEELFSKPYMSIKDVANSFDISFQAASNLVAQFEKAEILKEITGKKRDKRFIYAEYLNILEEGTKP